MNQLAVALLLSASVLIAQPRNAGSITTHSTQVLPLVILGEGWTERLLLQNVDDSISAIGTISFYTRDGQPWPIALRDRGTASTFLVALTPGQTAVFETLVSFASQQLGWAIISLGGQGSGDLLGQVVFRKQADGRPDLMTSMILGDRAFSRTTTFFDNTGGNYTGMGILTSELCTLSSCQNGDALRVTIRDLAGTIIGQKQITQKRGTLYWMNLGVDFPETNGKTGTFAVEPVSSFSVYLTSFSLQFAGNGAFTAITPFED